MQCASMALFAPQIKYIAAYQVSPVQAITHVARVKSIEPCEDSGKFVLNFDGPAEPIGPISLNGANPQVWSQVDLHKCRRCGRWQYRHQKTLEKTAWQPTPGAIQKVNPS